MGFLKSIIGKIELDGSGFRKGSEAVSRSAAHMSSDVAKHIKGLLIGAGFGILIHKTIESASKLKDMSMRLKESTDVLQEFGYTARQNGAELDDFVGFLEKVNAARDKALGGNKKVEQSFKALGVSMGDLQNERGSGLAKIIGNAVKGGDIQKLITPLREVGGRGAGALVRRLRLG